MTAVNAVDVGNAHATVAIAAGRGDLVSALGTDMKLRMNTGGTGRAARDYRLAEEKVQHRSDAARHSQADHHPKAGAHAAARRIPAHITNHEHVQGGQRAPGESEVKADAERSRNGTHLVGDPISRQDYPVEILHEDEHQGSRGDRPAR